MSSGADITIRTATDGPTGVDVEGALEDLDFDERYATLHELASGGMGKILVTKDHLIGRDVCLP